MKEHDEHIEFEILTGKYLAGETTAEEQVTLENWVKASEANKRLFLEWKHAWQMAGINAMNFNIEKAKQTIAANFATEESVMHKIPREPATRKLNISWRIAAAVVIFAALGFLLFTMFGNNEQQLVASKSVVAGTLADGSKITLNQNSTLVYPKKFDDDQRKVKLNGDAFFEVAKNPEKPFIIEAGETQIKVLGTSFYVDARPGQNQVEVTVKSGRVALIAPDQSQVILTAGQKGIFIKNEKDLYKEENPDENYLAWKTGLIRFENTELGQVAKVLNRTYGVHITLQNRALENCRITANFDNQTLADILLIVSETLDISVNRTANSIILSGKGCD
ncbi:MAG TPA: FecR domain-containing protein [Bacteroidales bacterium]|nr:FecR domain-containing protein [Bacteroidales bacterium]HRX95823.1 FecR domain-containing protein [Bacteroidales bacterium]